MSSQLKIKFIDLLFYLEQQFDIFFRSQSKMGLLSNLKGIIKFSDFFSSSEMLRYEDQQEYRTLTGGLLSLAIIVTTFIGFASMIIDTLNLTSITTETEIVKNPHPSRSILSTKPGSNFMFGIQIWKINLNLPTRYFDILYSVQITNGLQKINSSYLPLVACTREHWNFMPDVMQSYDQLEIGNWMCPPIGVDYEIYGKYSSSSYASYLITVSGCTNDTGSQRLCAPQEQIDQLFTNFSQFFYFTIYYTNPIINPGHKNYKSYYLEDENFIIFGDMFGTESSVFFTDYTINTDQSIWPFEDNIVDKGTIVESLSINHPFQTMKAGTYVFLTLCKSSNSITYSRSVQKISSVFSFIGGMISAISAFLFFIKTYTSLSFEISIALSVFRPEEDRNISSKPMSMNFITFLKYQLYKFSKMIGIDAGWPNFEYIQECQQEIIRQLDVRALIKRVIFLQHCMTYVFQDYQLDGIQIKTPTTPQQIKTIREKCVSIIDEEILEEGNVTKSKISIDGTSKDCNKLQSLASPSPLQSNENRLESRKFTKTAKQVVIEDLINDSIESSSQVSGSIRPKFSVLKTKNSIHNEQNRQGKRISLLQILCQNATEGNEISKRIWNSLPREEKKKTSKIVIQDTKR